MSLLRHVAAAPSRVASATGLSQDNIIFAMVLFAFLVWITTKGELPTYLSYFKPVTGKQGPAATNVQASSTTAPPTASSVPSGGDGANPVTGVVSGLAGAAGASTNTGINNAINSVFGGGSGPGAGIFGTIGNKLKAMVGF